MILFGVAAHLLAVLLARVLQNSEPLVLQSIIERYSLVRVILKQLFCQISGLARYGNCVAELVISLYRVVQNLGDGVVVEGESSGQPGSMGPYMKNRITPIAKLSILNSYRCCLSTSGAM